MVGEKKKNGKRVVDRKERAEIDNGCFELTVFRCYEAHL